MTREELKKANELDSDIQHIGRLLKSLELMKGRLEKDPCDSNLCIEDRSSGPQSLVLNAAPEAQLMAVNYLIELYQSTRVTLTVKLDKFTGTDTYDQKEDDQNGTR